jgi:hypothetical protein
MASPSGVQRGKSSNFREIAVSDGERLVALFYGDGGDAEHTAQPVLWDLHGAGRGCCARRGLQERGRAGGVERHRAFHLLHDLVNVAVEHRH